MLAGRRTLALLSLPIALLGCQANVAQARAAVDLQCPEESVQIQELPGNAYRAEGCGKHAVYACSGGTLLSSEAFTTCTREAEPAPAPATSR
ncbi:MAG: hypothetical protein U0359_33715 [Byssovorax sp.]